MNAPVRSLTKPPDDSIPTRKSLLIRLKHWDDHESWRDFFNTYWKLIYHAATRAGLSDTEAQDVVQETVIVVAKKMETFTYDPAVDSFKGWLLYVTRKQIAMQFRRRQRARGGVESGPDGGAFVSVFNQAAEPALSVLDETWDEEWDRNLIDAAIANVKRIVNPKQFQIFNFYVLKEWPVREVTEALDVSATQVHLAKHRISRLIKKEVQKLERTMI